MTVEPTIDNPRSRRQVLCGLAIALVAPGALAAACSDDGGSTGYDSAPGTGGGTTTGGGGAGAGGGALAKVADVPTGGGLLVDGPNGKKILLVQPSAGTVKAFDPTCTHMGSTVGTPKDGTITCPSHGSTFDGGTGALKGGPATKPLTEVAVKVSGADIVMA